MLRVFFPNTVRRPLLLVSKRPFAANAKDSTSDEESARPLRSQTDKSITSFMDRFARKIDQSRQNVSVRQKQQTFNDFQSQNAQQYKMRKQVTQLASDDPNNQIFNDMLEGEVNKFYKQMFYKKKQAFMESLLENDSDELFKILLDLKKNVRVDVDSRLDTLEQILAICQQKEEEIKVALNQLKETGVGRSEETKEKAQPSVTPDEVFIQKFGMKRQSLIDRWIMMDESELIEQCEKYEIPFQKGQQILSVLLNYAENVGQLDHAIKKAEFKKMVKNSVLFGGSVPAPLIVGQEVPHDDNDDIGKIARQAQIFKTSLNQKLQKQEEQERAKAERKQKENNQTPGPVRELKRFEFKPEMEQKGISTQFYSSIPSLQFSLTRLQRQLLDQASQSQAGQVKQDLTLNTTDFDPKEVLRRHIKESKGSDLKQLAKTLAYARENEEYLKLHADLKREFGVFLKNLDNQFKSFDLMSLKPPAEKAHAKSNSTTFVIPKSRSGDSQFSFIEDMLYFALKPDFEAICPAIKNELISNRLLKVPSVQQQTLPDLKSLASILAQLMNQPVKRNKLGQLVDDSDLDKFQRVVSDVQSQFVSGMMPFSQRIEEIPITLRANMLLLFPSLDKITSPEMTAQLEALILSITKSAFKSERSQGNTELSNSQVVYMTARIAQFYDVNNDLVTNFRAAILRNLYPAYFTRQQLFMMIKTQASDQTVLTGPKGLNDVQFFTGCEEGCKYDPFMPSNQIPLSEILKNTKVGRMDQSLVNSFYVQAPLTLSISQTIKDYQDNLYMTDYVHHLLPPFIEQSNEYYTRKQIQSMLNLLEKYELSVNTLLRQTAMLGTVVQRIGYLGIQVARISMESKSQSIKRDADRELLQRFCDALTYKMIVTNRIYAHTSGTPQSSKRYFKKYIIDDETLITFNVLTKDLLSGDDFQLASTKKDIEIINSYLQYPLVAHRIFNTPEEAKHIVRVYFDKNMQIHEVDKPQKLLTQEQQDESLRQFERAFLTLKNFDVHCINDPETEKIRAHMVKLNILKFAEQLNNFSATSQTHEFPLKQFMQTNAALLEAIQGEPESTNELMQLYIKTIPAIQISSNLLSRHNCGYNIPVQDIPLSPQSKELVEKVLESTNWRTVQSMNNAMINHFLYLLKFKNQATANARMKQFWGLEDQCSDYLLRLRNIRTLHGANLAKLIEVISYLPQRKVGEFDQLLVDITPTVGTVQVQLVSTDLTERQKKIQDIRLPKKEQPEIWLQQYYKEEEKNEEDIAVEVKPFLVPEFDAINQKLLARHNEFQLKLIKLFCESHKRTLSQAHLSKCNLRELSTIFQLQFENLNIEDQISCLSILGNSFENYNDTFAMKLFELFDNEKKLDKLFKENNTAFFKLAQAWPQFLKNSAITKITTSAKLLEQPLEQQYAALKVLTDKLILHPELINQFFLKIVPLTDRELVKKYLHQLVSTMSLLGYTGDVSMQMVAQLLRRLYKEPEAIDRNQLLDFLVCFALSNPDLSSFEKKNSIFVEQCLDLIEQTYTGAKTTTVLRIKPQSDSAKQDHPEPLTRTPVAGHPDVEEFSMYYFPTITKTGDVFKKSMQVVLPVDDHKNLQAPLMHKYRYLFERDLAEIQDEEEENVEIEKAAEQLVEKVEPETQPEIQTENENGIKIYDRRASDTGRNDDVMLTKLKDQSWKRLSKKSRYNMIYSTHQDSLIDFNDNQTAKAWAVLYHFRGKTTESMLFEEFNAVAQRFANQKANMYDMFGKFYYQLLEHYSNEGVSLNLSRSCPQTGWPMDIQLVPNAAYQFKYGEKRSDKQYAIYFLVTQEMCANSGNRFQLEPLGLQKLMQRHFKHHGDFKVLFVTEDDVFQNMTKVIDGVKETLKDPTQVEIGQKAEQRQVNV